MAYGQVLISPWDRSTLLNRITQCYSIQGVLTEFGMEMQM
jgi:hypothetical protein